MQQSTVPTWHNFPLLLQPGLLCCALLEEAYRREGRHFIGNSVVQCDKTLECLDTVEPLFYTFEGSE
jgi:hypothetical protein